MLICKMAVATQPAPYLTIFPAAGAVWSILNVNPPPDRIIGLAR
jgi:hypothetical protein